MIRRLSVQQAAAQLGVSPATVRRMIRAGQLRAEREERPQGSRWVVLWDDDVHASQQASARAHATSQTPDALRVALATIEDLRRRLDAAEQAQAELRQLLAAEMQRPRLPAPTMPHTGAETAETGPPPARPAGAPRPWWRRLLRL